MRHGQYSSTCSLSSFSNVSDDEILGGGTGGGGGGIPLDHSSDEDNADAGRVPANTNRRVVPPRSPGTPRKVFTTGHRLTLKKGRRSRHRYDSERQLFACADEFEGFNPDDPNSSWNPEREYRSHFTDLLDNDNLLELFVGESDSTLDNRGNKSSRRSRPQPGTRDPEEQFDAENAYMRINAKLRNAIKKHTPWVGECYLVSWININNFPLPW